MERDFLGLSSKNVAMTCRDDEFKENFNNSASATSSAMQWSFSNKVSAVPQLFSFKSSQDEKQRRALIDPFLTSAYVTTSSTDAANLTTHRSYSALVQKNAAGNQYAIPMTVHPFQNSEAQTVHRSQEVQIFPISNQTKSVHPMVLNNVPIFQSQLVSSGQAVVGSATNLQPFGGVPVATSVSVLPSTSTIIGTADLRNASKSPGTLAQLTIFYDGSVSVFNDISPEKAQAIMFLAGSELPQTQNKQLYTGHAQALLPSDGFKGLPLLGLSSPHSVSVSHHKVSPAGVGSCGNSELPTTKSIQPSASHVKHSEPPMASTVGSIAPTFIPAAVPQARKASLVRFLEKRKERICTSPYSMSKKVPDCASATLDLMA